VAARAWRRYDGLRRQLQVPVRPYYAVPGPFVDRSRRTALPANGTEAGEGLCE